MRHEATRRHILSNRRVLLEQLDTYRAKPTPTKQTLKCIAAREAALLAFPPLPPGDPIGHPYWTDPTYHHVSKMDTILHHLVTIGNYKTVPPLIILSLTTQNNNNTQFTFFIGMPRCTSGPSTGHRSDSSSPSGHRPRNRHSHRLGGQDARTHRLSLSPVLCIQGV